MATSKWLVNVFYNFSRVGNSLANGNRDVSVSGRLGYNKLAKGGVWSVLAAIVDWAFLPVDGKNHCERQAHEEFDHGIREGSDRALAVICALVVLFTPLIALVSYSCGLIDLIERKAS